MNDHKNRQKNVIMINKFIKVTVINNKYRPTSQPKPISQIHSNKISQS